MSLYHAIDERLTEATYDLPGLVVRAMPSTRPGIDCQFNGLMAAAKTIGEEPMALALRVADRLRHDRLFADVQAAPPGFLNFVISDVAILDHALDDDLNTPDRQRIILDFGGPNLAKALHVGHLRSLVIGESLRRILLARGHRVISDIHCGDWGLPIGMLLAEVCRQYPGFPGRIPDNFGRLLENMYPAAVAECERDAARMQEAQVVTANLQNGELDWIWTSFREASLKIIMPSIHRLDAHFDRLWGESNAQPFIDPVIKTLATLGLSREEHGALLVDVAQPNDNKPMPPIILRKADGGYTYATTDLATILERSAFVIPRQRAESTDRILYVADKRHALHFERVFRVARQLSFAKKLDLVHVSFGTVNGADGKPYKTRSGGVPTLESLLDAAVAKASERIKDRSIAEIVGIGAIKFADLITHRESGYVFDLDRMLMLEGKTGPYLQYACVRLRKILDASSIRADVLEISHPSERDLLLMCATFPKAVELAEHLLLPSFVAEYAFGLAQAVSRFYDQCEVLQADDTSLQATRMATCQLAYDVLSKCLNLLGIRVPDRM